MRGDHDNYFGDVVQAYHGIPARCDEKSGVEEYRKHVLVCTGPNGCLDHGSFEVRKRFTSAMDETQQHDVKVTSVRSMGYCDRGPIAVVYPDNVWYEGLSPDDVPQIAEKHLQDGEPVEGLQFDPDLPDNFQHFIICTFLSQCGPEGGGKAYKYFRQRARESDDTMVTVAYGCLKECSMGPMCCVYPSGAWYSRVKPPKFDDIWEAHVERNVTSKYQTGQLG